MQGRSSYPHAYTVHITDWVSFLLFLTTKETTCILNQLQQKPSEEPTQQFPIEL